MNLPSAVRPWAPWLHDVVPELAVALAPLVDRLAAAIGPMLASPERGGDDPDGYSGLTRSGSYERLLMSEWLLADAIPDEFIRRAAMGEHLFLNLEHRTPTEVCRCVILLDGGPSQIGNPRIAQVALLVVMARRSTEAGAVLQWGVLQGEAAWTSVVDRHTCRTMLAARSPREATDKDVERWLAAIEDRAPNDELWFVSTATHLGRSLPNAGRIALTEPVLGPTNVVTATVAARAHTASVDLPLPDPGIRTRLVRDPFAEATRRPPVPSRPPHKPPAGRRPSGRWGKLRHELAFSSEGRKLLCRQQDGNVLAFQVPTAGDRDHPKPRREWAPKDQLVAMGWHHQRFALLRLEDEGWLTLETRGTQHRCPAPEGAQTIPPSPQTLVIANHSLPNQGGQLVAAWTSPEGRAFRWPLVPGGIAQPFASLAESVLAFTRHHGFLVLVTKGEDGRVTSATRHVPHAEHGTADRAWLSVPEHGSPHLLLSEGGALRVVDLARAKEPAKAIPRAEGSRVWGVGGLDRPFVLVSQPDALAVVAGRAALLLIFANTSTVVPTGGVVVAAAACGGHIAFMTQDGAITLLAPVVWGKAGVEHRVVLVIPAPADAEDA